ncbi:hypothetical protein Slin15195_G059140 [Septoria linicola]|uniref:Uncharacterized protein n=1 Tax=Septoria linicola TaxID=215465 RepID=A0A9Q9APA1_9PEZI|nr:hypothetical protein Slin14017_G075000 [Septoria linicola]USW52595.1 hypothetical protein Slin15195_G059140 [Septoria linicola]
MRRENDALQTRINHLIAEQAEASIQPQTHHDSGTLSGSDHASNNVRAQDESDFVSSLTARPVGLLNAMATSSDQDASMLLAKLRSGYSWEELADEVHRNAQGHAPESDLLAPTGQTATTTLTGDDISSRPLIQHSRNLPHERRAHRHHLAHIAPIQRVSL